MSDTNISEERPYLVQDIIVSEASLEAARENLLRAAREAFGKKNVSSVGFRMHENIDGHNVTAAVIGFSRPASEIRRRQFMPHWAFAGQAKGRKAKTIRRVDITFDFPEQGVAG